MDTSDAPEPGTRDAPEPESDDASAPQSGDHAPFGFEDADTSDGGDHVAALTAASSWVGGPVQGVGIGETADGQPCVVVFADTPPDDLPAQVEGLPVRVEGSDEFHALRLDEDDHDRD